MRSDTNRRVFLQGYQKGRAQTHRQLEQRLAEMKAERDELRAALADWRSAVKECRAKEEAIVNFWRHAWSRQHHGASLH
jgi:uncharacterized coiled-coil DUF342 family protein